MNSFDLYNKNVPISLVDIVFSKSESSNETYAFILDNIHGVTKFLVRTNDKFIVLNRDDKFGLVNIKSGLTIAV